MTKGCGDPLPGAKPGSLVLSQSHKEKHMKTVGVIVGRFQVPNLHVGHLHLLNWARKENDHLVILIGSKESQPSIKNPLSYSVREKMIRQAFPDALVYELRDNPSDEVWSKNLDGIVRNSFPFQEVRLYGSRDSFASHYHGSFPCILIPEIPSISGTDVRKSRPQPHDEESFRLGLIEAQKLRYPVSFQTVDIGVIKHESKEILLGRKKTDPKGKWRLPGGFVDPGDSSLEVAAARELREEVGNIMTHEITYLGSSRVEDHRYRNECDKIMTALFLTYYMGGRVAASDDLEEVCWFSFDQARTSVVKEHEQLVKKLLDHIEGVTY